MKKLPKLDEFGILRIGELKTVYINSISGQIIGNFLNYELKTPILIYPRETIGLRY